MCVEEEVYSELKERILDGRLAPGTRLVRRRLALELGVSASPVLLCLRRLERDGLVTNTPGFGASVTVWSQNDIVDIYRMRAVHEGLAARICAERATDVEIAMIVAADAAFKEAVNSGDVRQKNRAEIDFHMAIVRGADSKRLAQMAESLSIVMCSLVAFAANSNNTRFMQMPYVRTVHEPIVAYISRRDADGAENAARKHVEDSLKRNFEWIEHVSFALLDGLSSQPEVSASDLAPAANDIH